MNERTLDERVAHIVAEQLGAPDGDVKSESHLERDLGADDIDRIEIVMALEDEFGIKLPDEECDQCATVADLCAMVRRHTEHRGGV